jgi:hypothetical protein
MLSINVTLGLWVCTDCQDAGRRHEILDQDGPPARHTCSCCGRAWQGNAQTGENAGELFSEAKHAD